MPKQAPICVLTATITPEELSTVKKYMGRPKAPLLVADGPVGGHTKICTIRRPSSDVDFLGRTLVDGSRQPGILELLRFLALDRFLEALRTGQNFPRTIIYFRWSILQLSLLDMCSPQPPHRSFETMVFVNSWLIGETGLQTLDETLWCMNHASLHASDDAVLMARKEEYYLFLTTNRFVSRCLLQGY